MQVHILTRPNFYIQHIRKGDGNMLYAYIRVSTEKQTDNNSYEFQEEAIQNLAKRLYREEIPKNNIYKEPISATEDPLTREMFSKLYGELKEGDALFLYKQDRLVRDADMLGYFRYTFRQRNIKLHCTDVNDGENSIGNEPTQGTVIAGVMGQVAALERKNILDRTKAGREKALEESKQTGIRVFGRKPKFTAGELAWCVRELASGASYRDTIAKFNNAMIQASI